MRSLFYILWIAFLLPLLKAAPVDGVRGESRSRTGLKVIKMVAYEAAGNSINGSASKQIRGEPEWFLMSPPVDDTEEST